MAAPHTCSAYCTAGEHCELVYASAGAREGEIAQAYAWRYGARVARVMPAREAPPLSAIPADALDVMTGAAPSGERAWLVWLELS